MVLNAGVSRDAEEIEAEVVQLVRRHRPDRRIQERDGGEASAEDPLRQDLRGIVRQIAEGEAYRTPATIDDPAILAMC